MSINSLFLNIDKTKIPKIIPINQKRTLAKRFPPVFVKKILSK
jgi:hypothetical protein